MVNPCKNKPPDPGVSYASKTKGGMSDNVMIYADIVMKQKKERAAIELKFTKKKTDSDMLKNNRNVDLEVVSEYIFGELEVKPDEIQEIDLNTGRYDAKQLLFKPGVDVGRFVNNFPDTYADYIVSVTSH